MTTDAGTATDHYTEPAVLAAADGRGEPGWLRDRRAEAARAFDATPLPTRALRPWRYTNVTGLDFARFAPIAGEMRISGDRAGWRVRGHHRRRPRLRTRSCCAAASAR